MYENIFSSLHNPDSRKMLDHCRFISLLIVCLFVLCMLMLAFHTPRSGELCGMLEFFASGRCWRYIYLLC